MAGKKQQTFAKLTRERAVREKRERKAEKKALAAEERARIRELGPDAPAETEQSASPETEESAVLSED
jgi:hypothetical protein